MVYLDRAARRLGNARTGRIIPASAAGRVKQSQFCADYMPLVGITDAENFKAPARQRCCQAGLGRLIAQKTHFKAAAFNIALAQAVKGFICHAAVNGHISQKLKHIDFTNLLFGQAGVPGQCAQ